MRGMVHNRRQKNTSNRVKLIKYVKGGMREGIGKGRKVINGKESRKYEEKRKAHVRGA